MEPPADRYEASDAWAELDAGPSVFLSEEDMQLPSMPERESHKGAWRRLFTGPFAKGRLRDAGLIVMLIWLCCGVVLFFFTQLIGYIYQQTLSPTLISGYTERFVGCWFFTLFTLGFSFLRTLTIWFRYRFCNSK
jgi:hypothetical protein